MHINIRKTKVKPSWLFFEIFLKVFEKKRKTQANTFSKY